MRCSDWRYAAPPFVLGKTGLFIPPVVTHREASRCLMLTPYLQLPVLGLVRVQTSCPFFRYTVAFLHVTEQLDHALTKPSILLRPSIRRGGHQLLCTRPEIPRASRISNNSGVSLLTDGQQCIHWAIITESTGVLWTVFSMSVWHHMAKVLKA